MKIPTSIRTLLVTGISLCLVAGGITQAAESSMPVTAGTLYGIGGSISVSGTATLQAQYGATQPDGSGSIYQLLDLGSVFDVASIEIINRRGDISTNYSVERLSIRVAPNEQEVGFDPFLLSNYTTVLFADGKLLPSTNAPGAIRPINLGDAQNRYLLIEFTKTFRNPVGRGTGYDSSVQFADITFTKAIPEPSTAFLSATALITISILGLRRMR